MATSDWLVGAWENHPQFDFTVNGNAKTIAAGSRYLWHATAAISLLTQIELKVQEEYATASVDITLGGKIKFSDSGAINFAWDTDTTLRDRLGHTGDFNTSSQVGANPTRYLWRSGATHSPGLGVLGSIGARRTDGAYGTSVSTQTQTFHNSWQEQDLAFTFIKTARFETAAQGQGEFRQFDADVIDRSYMFRLYREIPELETDTSVDLTSYTTLGPYKLRRPSDGRRFPFNRHPELQNTDIAHTIDLPVRTFAELT